MSLEVLTRWQTLLGEVGELGGALRRAIEGDDVLGAVAAMMQLRRTRAAIARVEVPLALQGNDEELALMAKVTSLTIDARAAEATMQRWLEREVPGDARLLSSPLGVAVLADMMLPVVWDFESDVVVLVGDGIQAVAEIMIALGQRRIVMLEVAGETPEGVLVVDSHEEASLAVRMMVPGPPSQMVVRAAPGSDSVEVGKLAETLRNALSDLRIHRNTVHVFSRTWVEQGIANLPAVARWPSIAAIGDRFAGKPMVIVAPGPSLANNIDQLRELRGRAILTAFSHSLKPVLAAGLVPDLVVTVDPQDVRYHFAGCDLSQTCLVNAATVHPSLFQLPAQRFLTLSANSAIDDWLFDTVGEDALVPGGGSVATTAFSLALKWRCDPIVFVGLDLSFPGGAYYVGTSTDGEARAEVDAHGVMRVEGWSKEFRAMKAGGGPGPARERAIDLPGWRGGRVPSSFMFSLFHRWFVDRIREGTGATIYNCTEGGAFIEGMQHQPLAEVLARLDGVVDVTGTLDRAAMTVDAARGAKIVGHLTGFARGLGRSRRYAKLARALIERGETGKRLAGIERGLANELKPLMFASLLAQRELDKAHDVARRPGSDREYLAASASLFDTLLGVIAQIEPALQDALVRLGAPRTHERAA